jgi:hypothetical protein
MPTNNPLPAVKISGVDTFGASGVGCPSSALLPQWEDSFMMLDVACPQPGAKGACEGFYNDERSDDDGCDCSSEVDEMELGEFLLDALVEEGPHTTSGSAESGACLSYWDGQHCTV